MNDVRLPHNLIPRHRYLSRVQPFIGEPLVKVITGQRRVGKSYLLFQIIAHIRASDPDASIIYINKEDLKYDALRSANDLNDYIIRQSTSNTKTYIFIDEIQEIIGFEKAIRSLLLDENNDIYLTGSNANLLSGELATLLAGRTIELTVFSLSYGEFLIFHELEDSDLSLSKYFKYGGLPYLKHLELTDAIIHEYLGNIYHSIIYKDIISRYALRNTHFLEQLIRFIADNVGSLFSAKRISDFLKSQRINMAPNQVQVFAQHLVDAFMVHKLSRYDLIGKRYFEVGDKYYFQDIGLRNIIVGYKPGDRAKIMENAVLNHLLFLGYSVDVGKQGDKEIDFVANRAKERIYIQVTLSMDLEKTVQREFGNLLLIKDNYPKYVISSDIAFQNSYEGIKHITIREFLMMENLN